MNRTSLAVLSLFSFLFLFSSISTAQLGEVAGQPHFNVSIGGSNSIQITVINEATYPLPVRVILPSLTSTDANAITPDLTANPMVATIPAGKELNINLTVRMPGGTNKPGYSWSGILQVVTAPNSTSGGSTGATIIEGVAKIVSISAIKSTFNIYDYLIPAVIVIIVVAAIVVAYKKGMFARKKKAQPTAAKTKAAATRKGKKVAAKSRRARKGKKSGAGRPRGRSKRTTRPRRRSRR